MVRAVELGPAGLREPLDRINQALAARADAVLIDVSRISENVLWEIEHADERWRARTVFVGHRDLVRPLQKRIARQFRLHKMSRAGR